MKFYSFLVPQSWYEVHLVAFNENGESRESVRNIITFSGDNPNAETVEGNFVYNVCMFPVLCLLFDNMKYLSSYLAVDKMSFQKLYN